MEELDRYIAHAAQCDRLAHQLSSPTDRETLCEIAAHWRRLADQAAARMIRFDRETGSAFILASGGAKPALTSVQRLTEDGGSGRR